MFLEVQLFDFLPAGHDACSAAETHAPPHGVEVLVVDDADIVGLRGECGKLVAGEVVVVVCHCVCEAADDSFSDICFKSALKLSMNAVEKGKRLTFIFWLCGPRVAGYEILVVVRTHGLEVHGARHI